jgi:hypothetical protein
MPKLSVDRCNNGKKKKKKISKQKNGKGNLVKPRNAWQIFYTTKRAWMVEFLKRESNGIEGMHPVDKIPSAIVMKALGNIWNNLSPVDKLYYDKIATNESKIYNEKMEIMRKDDRPRRPKTAFLIFVDSYKETAIKTLNIDSPRMADVIRVCSKEWNQLNNHEKEIFNNEYTKKMDLYHREVVKYTNKQIEINKKRLMASNSIN